MVISFKGKGGGLLLYPLPAFGKPFQYPSSLQYGLSYYLPELVMVISAKPKNRLDAMKRLAASRSGLAV